MLMIVKIFGLITLIKSEIWLTSYGMMLYAVYFITSLIKIDTTFDMQKCICEVELHKSQNFTLTSQIWGIW